MAVINRISTLTVHQSTLRDAGKVMSRLADLQNQLSSGFQTDNYKGLDGQVSFFSNLESKITRSKMYYESNTQIINRLSTSEVALTQLYDMAVDANTLMVGNTAVADKAVYIQQLQSLKTTIGGQLNTSLGGIYLFGGTESNLPPVKMPTPSPDSMGVPDDSYYQGSKENLTVRADDNFEFEYNIRADESAFQKLFASIDLAIQAQNLNDNDLAADAKDMIAESIQGINALVSVVRDRTTDLEASNDRHESLERYWKGLKEDVINTDPLSVSTEVALSQSILTAAFQSFSRINSLRLVDFLK